jgi:uncharacterized protein (UPF0248 family)
MRPAQDVVQRVMWDDTIASQDVLVGYEDRFTGVQERPFNDFNWTDDLGSLSHLAVAIPRHRVVHYTSGGPTMLSRPDRLDHVFASTGGPFRLPEFIAHVDSLVEHAALAAAQAVEADLGAQEAQGDPHTAPVDAGDASADEALGPTHDAGETVPLRALPGNPPQLFSGEQKAARGLLTRSVPPRCHWTGAATPAQLLHLLPGPGQASPRGGGTDTRGGTAALGPCGLFLYSQRRWAQQGTCA